MWHIAREQLLGIGIGIGIGVGVPGAVREGERGVVHAPTPAWSGVSGARPSVFDV